MNYIIFDKQTGEILLSISGDMEGITLNDNEDILSVEYEISNIYKNSGKWVNLQTKEIIDFGPKPFGIFTLTSSGWVRDIETEKICFAEEARATRNLLLNETDWTDNLSAKNRLGEELYQKWQDYRQALRDIPQQESFPFSIVWPVKPE